MNDLRAELLAVIAPLRIGDEVLPGVTLVEASTELGLRLTFTAGAHDVHVEVAPAAAGRPHAARSAALTFAYRAGEAGNEVDPVLGRALCEAVAQLATRNEAAVLGRIGTRATMRPPGETMRVREVRVDRLLEIAGTPDRRYDTLSPYVGCLIGCRFCYAQSRLALGRELEGLPEVPWGSWVDVRVNAAEVLGRELAERPVRPIKLCPIVSDPYQAVETKHRITRACLEVLAADRRAADRAVLVLTRSARVMEDAALLARIPNSYVGVSLPTADDEVRRHFEPRAASIDERLHALRILRDAGVRTFAMVQPLLPGSVEDLAGALAATVGSVRIDTLHGVESAGGDFADPRYAEAAHDDWQRERAQALAAALTTRNIPLWSTELPPDL